MGGDCLPVSAGAEHGIVFAPEFPAVGKQPVIEFRRAALDSGVVGKSPAQHGGETFSVFAPVIDQLLIQELNRENIVAGHRQPQRLRVGADSAEIM